MVNKVNSKQIPQHVAIIMDGNGRWAQNRGLASVGGHAKGVEVAKDIVGHASKIGIKYLTLYTFSSENWLRSEEEVMGIMNLLKHHISNDRELILNNEIRLKVIGDFSRLSRELRSELNSLAHDTRNNRGMQLIIALSYGARDEIVAASKKLAMKVMEKKIAVNDITEKMFAQQLYTVDIPEPGLLIRTGKELRVSNFLLWQIAYTEFYFSDILWPDFTEHAFDKALNEYMKRERRYGK